jgi:NAD(P)H-dependent FMN reductase
MLLAISGSLRAASLNTALLRTAQRLAPADIEVRLCTVVAELPLFNPDLQAGPLPPAVQRLYAEVAAADALLVASPEYAHGVSGVVKNLLDWLVSFEPFVHKPVAVLNASPRAHHADAALRETLRTMSADLVEGACLCVPLLGSGLAEADMARAPEVAGPLATALAALRAALEARRPAPDALFPVVD